MAFIRTVGDELGEHVSLLIVCESFCSFTQQQELYLPVRKYVVEEFKVFTSKICPFAPIFQATETLRCFSISIDYLFIRQSLYISAGLQVLPKLTKFWWTPSPASRSLETPPQSCSSSVMQRGCRTSQVKTTHLWLHSWHVSLDPAQETFSRYVGKFFYSRCADSCWSNLVSALPFAGSHPPRRYTYVDMQP